MRIVWVTDIHLNFVDDQAQDDWFSSLSAEKPDAVLIGGDIGEAKSVGDFLLRSAKSVGCPVYFVLGNHDFYGSSIEAVRRELKLLAESSEALHYLSTAEQPIELTKKIALIGHDGWADGRIGDYMRSLVMMNDYRLIEELCGMDKASRWQQLQELGEEAAEHIESQLELALEQYNEVYLLTHVPPFREACWHEGKLSNDEWIPHFTCAAIGDVLRDTMRRRPDQQLTVFCGHTHGAGTAQPLPNVRVETGAAEYGSPGITRTWSIDDAQS